MFDHIQEQSVDELLQAKGSGRSLPRSSLRTVYRFQEPASFQMMNGLRSADLVFGPQNSRTLPRCQ